jgi:hypothetical protein
MSYSISCCADGARKDVKPPRKSLTNPRYKEMLMPDAPEQSWEQTHMGMSDNAHDSAR